MSVLGCLVGLAQTGSVRWFLEVVVVSWFCVGDLIPNLVPSLDTVEVVVLEVQCCLGR